MISIDNIEKYRRKFGRVYLECDNFYYLIRFSMKENMKMVDNFTYFKLYSPEDFTVMWKKIDKVTKLVCKLKIKES